MLYSVMKKRSTSTFYATSKCHKVNAYNYLSCCYFCFRCNGCYEVCLYESVPEWLQENEKPVAVAHIDGMNGDTLAYATQSSEGLYLVDYSSQGEKEICRAEIHSANFHTTEKKLYISLSKKAVSEIRKRFCRPTSFVVEVEFEVKHGYFNTLHQAIVNLPSYMIQRLMPKKNDFLHLTETDTVESSCEYKFLDIDSDSQLATFRTIVAASPKVPVVISGPFGSGKTRLLACAAYHFAEQGLKNKGFTRVLICAHHPASTQTYITKYFMPIVKDREQQRKAWNVKLIRIIRGKVHRDTSYACYRNIQEFSQEIRSGRHVHERSIIIIATYMMCSNLFNILKFPKGFFTHILLDEATQVREPEAVIPLCLATRNAKVIIAGDSKQVMMIDGIQSY